jgi:hypothetical protein
MTEYAKTIRRGASAITVTAALMISAGACTSTTSTTPAGGASHTFPTLPSGTVTASSTASGVSDAACTTALDALQTEGQDLVAKISDPPSAQSIANDLQTKLNAAGGQATVPAVKTAITNVASDIGRLATALAAHDDTTIQNALGKDATDATSLVSACNG